MWPYLALFSFFALGALMASRSPQSLVAGADTDAGAPCAVKPLPTGVVFVFGLFVVTLMIGLRYKVGADYQTYQQLFDRARLYNWEAVMRMGDWGYHGLSALLSGAGGSLWHINIVCGLLFCWGIYRLAQLQREPWLVLVVAIPYLITVVAMGYTRQAAALGILMMGLAAVLRGGGVLRFAIYVAVAALFHRTAVVTLPMMMFVFPQSRATSIFLMAALSVSLYTLFLQDAVDQFQRGYLQSGYQSQGAAIRIAQLVLAAGLFLALKSRFAFSDVEHRLWRNYSFVAMAMAALLLVSPSSTAVDRVSLYLMPLQLAILSRLPQVLINAALARLLVVAYSALVLFVWLNFAAHASYWLPYDTILSQERTR